MKKSLPIVWTLLLTLSAGVLSAQQRDTLAYWGFNSVIGNPTNEYQYWGEDEINGTVRAWAYNEYDNERTVTFGAWREGTRDGEAIGFADGHTLVTTTQLGPHCLNTANWHKDAELGRETRYWLLNNLSTKGMKDIEVSLYLVSVGTQGPSQFRFGYKIGDGNWVDEDFKNVRTGAAAGSPIGSSPDDLWKHVLPEACNNQDKVAFRWCVNEIASNGGALVTGSSSRVDDVTVTGIAAETSLNTSMTPQSIQLSGNTLSAGEDVKITIYNQVGLMMWNGSLLQGESMELLHGINIIRAQTGNKVEIVKALVR